MINTNALPPHQQRVVIEHKELVLRTTALTHFIGLSDTFETLDPAEQERLRVQNDLMWQYATVLGERIAAFK